MKFRLALSLQNTKDQMQLGSPIKNFLSLFSKLVKQPHIDDATKFVRKMLKAFIFIPFENNSNN
jgi:hypothetical protein